jgi:hypothetical protein
VAAVGVALAVGADSEALAEGLASAVGADTSGDEQAEVKMSAPTIPVAAMALRKFMEDILKEIRRIVLLRISSFLKNCQLLSNILTIPSKSYKSTILTLPPKT